MKKEEQSIDTMQMVRAARDKLGELRRENPAEYFPLMAQVFFTCAIASSAIFFYNIVWNYE